MKPGMVAGLPLHPLVAHAAVVFIPLAALGTILIALWPAAARRLWPAVLFVATLALASVPITTESGEALEERVGESPIVERHVEQSQQVLPWIIVLWLAAAGISALVYLRRRNARSGGNPGPAGSSRHSGNSGHSGSPGHRGTSAGRPGRPGRPEEPGHRGSGGRPEGSGYQGNPEPGPNPGDEGHRAGHGSRRRPVWWTVAAVALAVMALVGGVGGTVEVILAGHSGAAAVWKK